MAHAHHTSNGSRLKRKKIFFLRGFQLRYALLVGGALTVLLLFAGFHAIFIARTSLSVDVLKDFEPVLMASSIRLFLVGALYIAVVVVAAIFLSHREVGPTYRIEEELVKISAGEKPLAPLKIRKGDALEELVRAINDVIERKSRTGRK